MTTPDNIHQPDQDVQGLTDEGLDQLSGGTERLRVLQATDGEPGAEPAPSASINPKLLR